MATPGLGERALKLMTERALARTAFRKLIAEQGAFRKQLAECRIELDAARCVIERRTRAAQLVLLAARLIF